MGEKKIKKHIVLFVFIILFGNLIITNTYAQSTSEKTYNKLSSLTFNQDWNTQKADIQKPSAPNVWNVLNNITRFSEPNDTVYVGDDPIPEPLMEGIYWSKIQINLTALYVWDDHNSLGAGDIYVRWVPNYWIGLPEYDLNLNWQNYQYVDDLTIDHDLYFETGIYKINENLNDWYNFSTPITLFEGWTVLSCLLLEVFEDDYVSFDESLGGFYWTYQDPNDLEGYHEISATDVDIALTFTILDTNSSFTAKDLTELFQPFLIDNDDTSHTADPDGLFARVIYGYDPAIGRRSLCIQYLYFWKEVWLDGFWSDQLIHYYDYELIQVYLNFSYTGGPLAYRFVFDNHDEYTNSPTEWRDSMEYAIYEWDATESGIQTKIVENTVELQPLLGKEYLAKYEYKNLSAYIDSFCGCYGGVPSIMLTIETYNHQFAMGFTDGDILGQYHIAPFNDSIVYGCYALVNRSFTGGIHDVEGFTVPNYAPFAYDVLKVFEVPYIHSNYDHLMQQAASFQGSIEAEGGIIKIDRNIELTLQIPLQTSISLPDTLTPGEKLTSLLSTIIDSSKAALTIDYFFNITADFSIFFVDYHFETYFQNQICINFSNPIIQLLCNLAGLNDENSFSLDFLTGMLTIDATLTPQLLGEILNCNITLHIDEILKSAFPAVSWIVDLLFKDIYFKINPILSGYLEGKLYLGDSVGILNWDSTSRDYDVDLTIPELTYGDTLTLQLSELKYFLNFQVGWYVGYETGPLIGWLFGDGKEYLLTTWPNLDFEIAPVQGTIVLNTWEATKSEWTINPDTNPNPENNPPPSISGYPIVLIGLTILTTSIVIIHRKHKKEAK